MGNEEKNSSAMSGHARIKAKEVFALFQKNGFATSNDSLQVVGAKKIQVKDKDFLVELVWHYNVESILQCQISNLTDRYSWPPFKSAVIDNINQLEFLLSMNPVLRLLESLSEQEQAPKHEEVEAFLHRLNFQRIEFDILKISFKASLDITINDEQFKFVVVYHTGGMFGNGMISCIGINGSVEWFLFEGVFLQSMYHLRMLFKNNRLLREIPAIKKQETNIVKEKDMRVQNHYVPISLDAVKALNKEEHSALISILDKLCDNGIKVEFAPNS